MGVHPPAGHRGADRSSELLDLQAAADEVYVDRGVVDYAVSLVLATREPADYGLAELTELHRLRRQPPRQPRPRRRRPGPRPAPGPQLRPAPGRVRRGPRRAAPPAGAVLRGPGPGRRRRPESWPGVLSTVPARPGRPRPGRDRSRRRVHVAPSRPALAARQRHRPTPRSLRRLRARRHPPRSTACCTATTAGLVPGHGPSPARPGPTSRATTSAASTGTSPPGCPRPHVRETIADRELETWVLRRPARPASTSAPPTCEKRDLALAAAAAIGFLTARTGNRLGVVRRGRRRRRVHARPAPGDGHLLGTAAPPLTARLGRRRREHVDLAAAIDALARRAPRRRGLVVVVSDFLGPGRLGAPAAAAGRPPRGPGRRGRRPPGARPCPTSACSSWSTPRPATSARSRPSTATCASATPRPPATSARTSPGGSAAAGRRPPGAAHRPGLAARPRPLRQPPQGTPRRRRGRDRRTIELPRPPLAVAPGRRRPRWPSSTSSLQGGGAPRTPSASPTSSCSSVAPKRPGWRRHLAAGLLLLVSLSLLVVALARPTRRRGAPRAGHGSSWPSTPRCRCRPPT